jgi:uncharacterized membrane protein
MSFERLMTTITHATELAGVAVMIIGFLVTAAVAAAHLHRGRASEVYRDARHRVGRAILLGLELLVAADIMRTIIEKPSLTDIAGLAAIVAIRTFLSFTIEIELDGRLPWRQRPSRTATERG